MTTLAITPNWKNKSAKFKGTVAAGEHVSVTIQNDDGEGEKVIDDASTLRLRTQDGYHTCHRQRQPSYRYRVRIHESLP